MNVQEYNYEWKWEIDDHRSGDCHAFGDLHGKAEWGTLRVLIMFLDDYFVIKLQESWVGRGEIYLKPKYA